METHNQGANQEKGGKEEMKISRQEEIIGVLWIIASILAFGFHFNFFGWIFCIKGLIDMGYSISFALKEIKTLK